MATPSSVSLKLLAVSAAIGAASLGVTARAHADTLIIRHPGDHSRYFFEAEPHALIGLIDPPGFGSGAGFGVGFRGTFILVNNGFVPSINNSIGIGVGLDWVHYGSGERTTCTNSNGPSMACVTTNDISVNNLWIPVVMQWNFFLSRQWSVFGEPGLAVRYQSVPNDHITRLDPVFYAGGRWHFSDQMTLTMRLGYPTFSVGVSFM